MRTSKIFVTKNLRFFENYSASPLRTDKERRVEAVRIFIADKERSKFWAIFCGRFLWTTRFYFIIFKIAVI